MKKNYIYKSILCMALVCVLAGCPTPFSKQEEKTVTVTGQIQFKDTAFSLPQKSSSANESRSAFPTEQETVYYKVTAYQGTKSVDGDVDSGTYSVKLTQGKWIIVAKGYSDEACSKMIFEGHSSTVTVNDTTVPSTEALTIIVSPIKSDDVNVFGSIALDFKVPNTIKTIRITWISESAFEDEPDFLYLSDSDEPPTTEDSYYIYHFTYREISTGSYDVQIDFYEEEYIPSEENPNPVPANIRPAYTIPKETIDIFMNLTTDRWVSNSSTGAQSSPWLVVPEGSTDNTANFVLTQEIIDKQQSHSFYVDKTITETKENGTFQNPFKTIQKAIDTAIAQNDGEEYTIYIKNDYDTVVATEIDSSRNNYLAYIKNTSTKPLKITFTSVTSSKVTIDAKGTTNNSSNPTSARTQAGIFCLDASAPEGSETQEVTLTLNNLILTGGSLSDYGSAVRNIDASSKMNTIIIKNCEIKNNFSTDCGTITTGKYLKKLQIRNTSFSNNTVYGSEYGNGGALYLWSKDNEIDNCVFMNNKASTGVNFSNGESQAKDAGRGGAIYVAYAQITGDDESNTKIRNCIFEQNTSAGKGSALFITDSNKITVDIENCTIEKNTNGRSMAWGAVYLSKNANLNISGKNIILNNLHISSDDSNLCIEADSTVQGKFVIKDSFKESKIGVYGDWNSVSATAYPFAVIDSSVSDNDKNYIKENLADIFIIPESGIAVYYQPVVKEEEEQTLKLYFSSITHDYNITPVINENVTFNSLTSTIVNPGEEDSNRTVKFTLYDNTGNDVTTSCTNWNYTVTLDNSSVVTSDFYEIDSTDKNKITFTNKIKPGKLSITVSADYKGSVYSTTHNVEVINAQYFSDASVTSNPTVPTIYAIMSAQDLNAVSTLVNNGTITGENVTLVVVKNFGITSEDTFTSLGNDSSKPFKGIFDGNGCTITNDSKKYLFGYAQGGTIRNLIVDSTGAISISNSNYASFGNKITDEIVENCINKASIKQTSSNAQYLAGLFINVTGSETGNSKISNCRNEGNLEGQWYAAGLFHNVSNKSIITGCINKGTVTIDPSSSARCSYVGGISNYVSQSEILNCANYGDLKITSYSTPEEIYIGCITTQLDYSGKCINCLNNNEVIEINGGSNERCLGGIVGNIIGTETIVKNNCCLKTPSNATPINGKINDGSSVTSENNFYITTEITDTGTDGNIPFIQDSATKVCTTTSAYSANPNKDVITLLNEWITSSTGGNDSSYATYKKWSYDEDGEPTF